MSIKKSLPKQANFCKYISKVIIYIAIISKKNLNLNIWPNILN